ncbi:MAG: orotidine-5'-phosphate decarboxylase [Dehalococcoidia bacterium]
MTTFLEKLDEASRRNQSLLCVGLDPDPALMPVEDVAQFNRAIVEATADLVCAYKPNLAFYEALGAPGLGALRQTLQHIPPSIPVIGDAKRGDIGNTAQAYARALFEVWGFDAATVNPYLGRDAVEPFLEYADRGVLILCRTSNAGARDFQEAVVVPDTGTVGMGRQLFLEVALRASQWNRASNVGLVVGATSPQEQLTLIRKLCPEMPILIPGVGAQGGDLEAAVRHGTDRWGRRAIINASRQVLYASRGPDFAQAARAAAQGLRDEINRVLEEEGKGW